MSLRWYNVEFLGQSVRVPAVKKRGWLWFHWRGENFAVALSEGERRASRVAGQSQPGVVTAPMPGRVTQVAVKVGDNVEPGQALVVMEAMKMEYTLSADIKGTVQEVLTESGRQASQGDVLVRLKLSLAAGTGGT